MAYIGPTPIPKASLTLTQGTLASSSQTITVAGGYTPGNIFVYINGYRLQTSEYTASDGSIIDLGEVFPAGTDYVVEEVRSFTLPDAYTKAEIQNASFDFANMPTVGGDPVVESGSNSDGEWVRWADGTQVCYHAIIKSNINLAADSQFSETWTYPMTFLEVKTINITGSHSTVTISNARVLVTHGAIAMSQFQTSMVVTNLSSHQMSSIGIRLESIGRWK